MVEKNSDVLIVGGGLIGLCTACFLAKSGVSVNIVEKEKITDANNLFKNPRTTAIAEDNKIILDRFGLWKKIRKYVEPIECIRVHDRKISDKIIFNNKSNNAFLGYIIENKFLKKILINEILSNKRITLFEKTSFDYINIFDECVVLRANDKNLYSSLLIAADGKKSYVRSILKQPYYSKNYKQNALVVNFVHSKKHNNIAYEIFYDSGPLATLPMMNRSKNVYCSSLVWSHTPDFIKSLNKVDDSLLIAIIDEQLEKFLGSAKKILKKHIFSLSAHINAEFYSKRVIYIGDSAHSIHPIAGQGWNLGMRDANVLIKIINKSCSLGIDLGSDFVCKKYHDQRYFDAFSLYQITDKLNSIFMLQNYGIKTIRKIGFNIIDNNNVINSKISDFAMGKRL